MAKGVIMRVVVLSDNHTRYNFTVPEGDLLIHCGDFSYQGRPNEMFDFADWLTEQPHQHKVWVWGNHELGAESNETYWADYIGNHAGATCLHNKELEIDGYKLFGSSFTPIFRNWAFMKDLEERQYYWETVAPDCDILISHGPPLGLLDTVDNNPSSEHLGCMPLRNYLERVKPQLACWGHIHGSGGEIMTLKAWEPNEQNTTCINAALLDERYTLVRDPIIFDL